MLTLCADKSTAVLIQFIKFKLHRILSILIVIACHYPDLGSTSNCLKQISLAVRPIRSTTQDLASDTSSEWNFCTRSSDVTWRGNKWWCRKMSAAFSRYIQAQSQRKYVFETTSVSKNLVQLGQFILLQKLQTVLCFLTSKIVKLFYTLWYER